MLALATSPGLALELPAGASPSPAPPPQIEAILDSVLESLHEGEYGQARQILEQLHQMAPSDPGVLFFQAYALAWQGAHNIRALASDPAFMYLLDAIQTQAERKMTGHPEEARLAYYLGLASLMRARTRFNDGKRDLLRAAADTRRGVRALERAMELDYEVPDASFWIGAYHTMAGSLPVPLRALRVLIGLPGGKRSEGIEELRRALDQGRRFRLEAGLFLAGALGEGSEASYAPAMDLLRRVLPETSRRGSVLPLFAGELLADWGLTAQAMALWEGVLERHSRSPSLYNAVELTRVRYGLARALWEEVREHEAIPHLEAILEQAEFGSPRLRERCALLLARCMARLGLRAPLLALREGVVGSEGVRKQIAALAASPLPEAQVEAEVVEALRRWRSEGVAAARPLLEDFLIRYPQHLAARLHAGRAAFELGLDEESARHFSEILSQRDDPAASAEGLGWAHLYLGWLADRAGRRAEALEHYRRAERQEGFAARRAGALYAQIPYRLLPCREGDVWAFLSPAASALRGAEPAGGP